MVKGLTIQNGKKQKHAVWIQVVEWEKKFITEFSFLELIKRLKNRWGFINLVLGYTVPLKSCKDPQLPLA